MKSEGVHMKTISALLLVILFCCECGAGEPRVRPSCLAGSWYTAAPSALREEIEGYLRDAKKIELGGPPVALISPHAGYRFSGKCAASAYATLQGRDIRRVIILAPSHRTAFYGASIADVDFYETPLGRVPVDRAACDEILKSPLVEVVKDADPQEHSLEIQLPFLQVVLGEFKIIPVVLGNIEGDDFTKLADTLGQYLDSHTIVIASSDFTHYGANYNYTPFKTNIRANIEKLDKGAIDRILKRDRIDFTDYCNDLQATICGRAPIGVMLEMLTPDSRGQLADYYMSGDRERDYSMSVSYAAIVFAVGPGELSAGARGKLLDIARQTLRATLEGKDAPEFKIEDAELAAQRGVFVTYKNSGRLRGCIGCFESSEPLWKTVSRMAVASARDDLRFADNPILKKEEPAIDIEISILSPMVPIKDSKMNRPLKFIPGVHGLYVKSRGRAGTYLPQVAEELDVDKTGFISHLCRYKIGLPADAWQKEGTEVSIYSAEVFGDKK